MHSDLDDARALMIASAWTAVICGALRMLLG